MMDILALSFERIVLMSAMGTAIIVLLVLLFFVRRRLPKKINKKQFESAWINLKAQCAKSALWAHAVISADDLLDDALRKRRFKGKNTGERLVSAQRVLTDNDSVWFAHKLRLKMEDQKKPKLTQNDVKEALMGVKQALIDLGAL